MLGIGDWGLGIGDRGLGLIISAAKTRPKSQSPKLLKSWGLGTGDWGLGIRARGQFLIRNTP